MPPHPTPLRLLLLGAGHAHLEVLRRLALHPLPVELTVVAPEPLHLYSGMIPGYLRGTYAETEIAFRIDELTRRAGGRLAVGEAMAIDPQRRTVRIESATGGKELGYDLLSVAIGSDSRGLRGLKAGADVVGVKPIEQARLLRQRLLALASWPSELEIGLVVVGGGAAGVEIALAAEAVLRAARVPRRVTILEAGDEILAGYSDRFRGRAEQTLARRGIEARTGRRVGAVGPECVILADGTRVPSRLTVWVTGPVAWPLFSGSGLSLDDRGFLLVDDTLRSISEPRIFAAGDCATLATQPGTPKAGVYAVRQGPVLWRSLRATTLGENPPRYRAQKGFLSILNTADGKALLRYRAVVSHSRWAFGLKDWIDRRFVARYADG